MAEGAQPERVLYQQELNKKGALKNGKNFFDSFNYSIHSFYSRSN